MSRYHVEKKEFPMGHKWAVMDKIETTWENLYPSRSEARERARQLNASDLKAFVALVDKSVA